MKPTLFAPLLWLALGQNVAYGALTDLASQPLASLSGTVKPNILLVLDDSSSMQWSYLGDDVLTKGYANRIGYRSALCNQLYYNPALSYPLPLNATGQPYTAPVFTAAP